MFLTFKLKDCSAYMWHRIRPKAPRRTETEGLTWQPRSQQTALISQFDTSLGLKTQQQHPSNPRMSVEFFESLMTPEYKKISDMLMKVYSRIEISEFVRNGEIAFDGETITPFTDSRKFQTLKRSSHSLTIRGNCFEQIATQSFVLWKPKKIPCDFTHTGKTAGHFLPHTLTPPVDNLEISSSGLMIFSHVKKIPCVSEEWTVRVEDTGLKNMKPDSAQWKCAVEYLEKKLGVDLNFSPDHMIIRSSRKLEIAQFRKCMQINEYAEIARTKIGSLDFQKANLKKPGDFAIFRNDDLLNLLTFRQEPVQHIG